MRKVQQKADDKNQILSHRINRAQGCVFGRFYHNKILYTRQRGFSSASAARVLTMQNRYQISIRSAA